MRWVYFREKYYNSQKYVHPLFEEALTSSVGIFLRDYMVVLLQMYYNLLKIGDELECMSIAGLQPGYFLEGLQTLCSGSVQQKPMAARLVDHLPMVEFYNFVCQWQVQISAGVG